MKKIKNLIFDFGGVLYDIDLKIMMDEFEKIGMYENDWSDDDDNIFYLIEKGMIEPDQLINELAYYSTKNPSRDQIIFAFNSVLRGLSLESLSYLEKLSKHYNSYLLSNTNEIHYEKFYNEIMQDPGTRNFYNCFKKEYYSFDLGMRKPELEIFQYVINDSEINPNETIFIDDDISNIKSAKKTGLQTFWVNEKRSWKDLITEFDLLID